MSITLKCPNCSREFDYRAATRDQATIQILKTMPEFAQHGRLVLEYVELFETTRPLKPAKLLRILSELLDIWKACQFGFSKRMYLISREGIAQALKTVCNKKFDVPLENHNYLKKVMVTVSETEREKRAAIEEKALKEKEARIRGMAPPEDLRDTGPPAPIGDHVKKVPWRRE